MEDGKRQLLWDPKRPLPALHSKSWVTEGQVPQNDSLWLLLECLSRDRRQAALSPRGLRPPRPWPHGPSSRP